MFTRLIIFVICIALVKPSFTQDSLSIKDVQEIRYKSELLIKRELQDLLNNISQSGFDSKETEEIIRNSYGGSVNKIFDSEKARIENDLNPKIHSSTLANDIDIVKYLKDFDLFYSKTDNFSIAFNDISSSQVKKSSFIYVRVYFTSFFNNKYKGVEGETPYTVNNRVADIKIVNADNKWMPYITNIAFFDFKDTLNDVSNNIAIKKEAGMEAGNHTLDSTAAASIDAEIEARKRKQLMDEENLKLKNYNQLLAQGDKALEANSFTDALNFYGKAKDMMPYDPLPRQKINKAVVARESANLSKEQLFKQYTADARLAIRQRNYNDAIRYFGLSLDNKPTEKANLQAEVDALKKKASFLTEMDLNYKAGNYKEAAKQYSSAIKKNKDSDFYLGRARSYVKLNETSDALKDFTQAYELDNENLAALQGRADLYKFLGDAQANAKKQTERKDLYIKALTDYTSYLNIDKKNLPVYEIVAELQMLLYQSTEEAIKALDAGIEADSKAKQLYFKKGLLLIEQGDYRKADINFNSAIKIDSTYALAYYYRGVCQLEFRDVENAATAFASARRNGLDSEYVIKIENFGKAFYHTSQGNFKNNQYDSAIVRINKAIAIYSKDSFHYARGEYYAALKNYKEAITSYSTAISISKDYTDAWYKRGLSQFCSASYQHAIDDFTKANLPTYVNAYLVQKGIGEANFALKQYAAAVQYLEQSLKTAGSLKQDPPAQAYAEIYNSLCKAYYYNNNTDKAIEAGKNAIKKNNAFAEAYFNRGLAYHKAQKREDAIADYIKALSLDNKHPEWYYQLAQCQHEHKDYINAANNYAAVISSAPAGSFTEALYYRGQSNYFGGNYTAALPDYLNWETQSPDSLSKNFYYELGSIYLNTGRYDSASTCFNKALSTNKNDGFSMYGIATSYFLKGNTQNAMDWFEKSFQTKMIQPGEIKKDKLIGDLKNDKNFKALVKKYL